MVAIRGVRRLCSLCMELERCKYPLSWDVPVLSCEEFRPHPQRPEWHDPDPAHATWGQAATGPEAAGAQLGLCRNCGNQEGCHFPKPAGGVWHCEEYC